MLVRFGRNTSLLNGEGGVPSNRSSKVVKEESLTHILLTGSQSADGIIPTANRARGKEIGVRISPSEVLIDVVSVVVDVDHIVVDTIGV